MADDEAPEYQHREATEEERKAYEALSRPKPDHPELGKITTADKQCQYCDTIYKGRHKNKVVHENLARYGASTGSCPDCDRRFNRLGRRYGHMRAWQMMTSHSPEDKRRREQRT